MNQVALLVYSINNSVFRVRCRAPRIRQVKSLGRHTRFTCTVAGVHSLELICDGSLTVCAGERGGGGGGGRGVWSLLPCGVRSVGWSPRAGRPVLADLGLALVLLVTIDGSWGGGVYSCLLA